MTIITCAIRGKTGEQVVPREPWRKEPAERFGWGMVEAVVLEVGWETR